MADSSAAPGVSFDYGDEDQGAPALSPQSRDLIIRTTLGEAGNDPASQPGVASVILNRMRVSGLSAISTVLAPGQFESWSARPQELRSYTADSPAYQAVGSMVDNLSSGAMPDPTNGATMFYSPTAQAALGRRPPAWDDGTGVDLGKHRFFGGGPQVAMSDSDIAAMYGGPTGGASPKPMSDDDIAAMYQGGASRSGAAAAPSASSPAGPTNPYGALPTNALFPAVPAGPLANSSGDGWLSGLLKGAATAGIRGAGDIVGTVGNLGNAADYLTDQAQAMITGKPLSQVQQQNAATVANVRAAQSQSLVGRIGNALDPRAVFPNGADVSNPILSQTGAYVPTSEAGRIAQGAVQTAVGALGPAGAGSAAPGALASAAGMGALGTAATDASGSPLAGLAAGVGVPAAIGGMARAATLAAGRLSPETAQLADLARTQYGMPLGVGQISDSPGVRFTSSTVNRLPFSGAAGDLAAQQQSFNRAVSNTIGEDAPRLTPQVMTAARQRIGQVFEDVGNRTDVAADQQFQNSLQGVLVNASRELSPDEMRPLYNVLDGITDKIQGGQIDGRAYNALRATGSPLDRATDNQSSGTAYWARQMRDVLDDAFQRSASPEDQAALVQARQQWANLKILQPLAAKAPTGDIVPALLTGRVNANTGNALAFGGGGALGDLARIGNKFLKEPPSSGTAERATAIAGLKSLAQIPVLAAAGLGARDLVSNFIPNVSSGELLASAAAVPTTLAAGRLLGAGLRSNALGNAVINRSLGMPQNPGLGAALLRGSLPYMLQSAPGNALASP